MFDCEDTDLRDWRTRRSVIRDGVDVLALAHGKTLSPQAEQLFFGTDSDTRDRLRAVIDQDA
jgi:hypothetical protein